MVAMSVSMEEFLKRRKARNWAILAVLVGLCVLFYAITIARLTH
jgi:hypothetical protein